jgi:hypothetical protein
MKFDIASAMLAPLANKFARQRVELNTVIANIGNEDHTAADREMRRIESPVAAARAAPRANEAAGPGVERLDAVIPRVGDVHDAGKHGDALRRVEFAVNYCRANRWRE